MLDACERIRDKMREINDFPFVKLDAFQLGNFMRKPDKAIIFGIGTEVSRAIRERIVTPEDFNINIDKYIYWYRYLISRIRFPLLSLHFSNKLSRRKFVSVWLKKVGKELFQRGISTIVVSPRMIKRTFDKIERGEWIFYDYTIILSYSYRFLTLSCLLQEIAGEFFGSISQYEKEVEKAREVLFDATVLTLKNMGINSNG